MEKKYITVVALLIIVAVAVAGYLYWRNTKKEKPLETATETLEKVGESVPEIATNPIEGEVPELNPVEKVNPFQYKNPLR